MTVDTTFVEMIDRNLAYFSELFEGEEVSFDLLNQHQEGLRRSIQFGAKSADTNAKAADLFVSCFTFIEQQGNYQPWAQTAIRLANRFQGDDQYVLTRVVSLLGFLQQELGQADKAEQSFRIAERLALANEDTAAVANAWYYLGVLEYQNYRSEQAMEHLKRAHQLFEQDLSLDDKDNKKIYGFILNLMGLIYRQRKKYQDAEITFERAESIFDTLESDHFSTLTDMNLSRLYTQKGDFLQAEQKLVAVAKYAADKGMILRHADALILLCEVYSMQGRWQDAHDVVNAIQITELQKRGQIRHVAITKNDLGNSLIWLGRYDEAMLYLSETLPIWKQLDDMVMYANSFGSIGHVYARQGDVSKARKHYESALATLRQFGNEHRISSYILEFEKCLRQLTKKKPD